MKSKIAKQLEIIMGKYYTRFHMPGHKGRRLSKRDWFKYDFTEVDGSDKLSHPKGIIKEVLKEMTNIYGTKASYMLVNGSSAGIIASLLTVCNSGDSFIVPRNSHRSVYTAMLLHHIHPLYIQPTLHEDYGYGLAIDVKDIEEKLLQYPQCKGVVVTSPTYFGTCSDISAIANLTHKYNKILIVDEAHGPHFIFSNLFPDSSIELGADIVIQSTHKVLNTMTQTGILHLCSSYVDAENLVENINMMQSTSPSYPLLISIEEGVYNAYQEGEKILREIYDYYRLIKSELKGYPYKIIGDNLIGEKNIVGYDWTKIWIEHNCLQGKQIDKLLRERYNIQMEMNDAFTILGMMGMGTQEQDVLKLVNALKHIAADISIKKNNNIYRIVEIPKIETEMTLWEAHWGIKKSQKLESCVDAISGGFIIPYPPGIPIVAPGEVFTRKMIDYIKSLDGEDIMGLDEQGRVIIIKN